MAAEENHNHNHQKKIAVINDISGFGRCSITVALPIISVMKVQCCPLPTSILSNHTGFDSFFFDDYTDRMEPYMEEWHKLNLRFQGICTGFLGSQEQIRHVLRFFDEFGTPDTLIIVDPVMGDYGKTYATYTSELCREMRLLAARADILTPNLTEACILTDTSYREGHWRRAELCELGRKLLGMGPKKVVITGIPLGESIGNLCCEGNAEPKLLRTRRVGRPCNGTGDIFSAIIAADAVNGVPFEASVRKASRFIRRCIIRSQEMDLPLTDGVCFEELLYSLR